MIVTPEWTLIFTSDNHTGADIDFSSEQSIGTLEHSPKKLFSLAIFADGFTEVLNCSNK